MRKKLEFVSHGTSYTLEVPVIMGIVNCTPDSFLPESRFSKEMQQTIENWIQLGINILDVGGQSTRPGATHIDAETEWARVEPTLTWIRKTFPKQLISIDSFHPIVAKRALELGVHIINDVSAGDWEEGMFTILSQYQVPYVLMHAQGTPRNMQQNPHYDNIMTELIAFFRQKIEIVKKYNSDIQIWIDPGFGFGKNFEHNQTILQNLNVFSPLNCPILAGLSRKKMIQTALNCNAEEALMGSTLAHLLAVIKGASIIRTHDVAACIELKKIFNTFN